MMKINTSRFGELEVIKELTYSFAQGLPGFEHLRKFMIVQLEEQLPFCFLQSIEDSDVCFIIANPFVFFRDYEFVLPESAQQELRVAGIEDVEVWTVLSIRESLRDATLNLLAPIVLNLKTNTGSQIILHGSGYLTKHRLPAANTDEQADDPVNQDGVKDGTPSSSVSGGGSC